MVYATRNYWVFGLSPSTGIIYIKETLLNTAFWKSGLYPFSSEGVGDTYSIGSDRKS
jgi:hypothetical protein